MKKIVRILKNNVFGIVIGIVLCSVTIVLAENIASSMVFYDTSISHSNYSTVQGALDDLYNIAVPVDSTLSLIVHTPKGLSTELIAGLYRFQGVQDVNNTVDNYICFGTTSKSDCIGAEGDPDRYDRYMYRIIGINASGQLKLIKKEALNTAYQWGSSLTVEWPNSSLYANLNGSYFLTDTTYVPDSSWSNRIVANDWNFRTGDVNMDAATIASAELGATDIVNAKIGLMYVHDYYYGLEGGNNCSSSTGLQTTCKTSWLHLSNNDTGAPNGDEWTISRLNSSRNVSVVSSTGWVSYHAATETSSVRPVFYLRSGERIASGSGTIDDPFILA